MKRCLILLLYVFVFCKPRIVYSQTDLLRAGIAFEQTLSWKEVFDKAKQTHKNVFVDVFATWCGPCKQMDKDVYNNQKTGDFFNEHFISVKVQMDRTDKDSKEVQDWYFDADNIKKKYDISAYPSFLFLSADEGLLIQDIGFKNADELITLGQKALDPNEQINQVKLNISYYKKGKKDYTAMPKMVVYAKQTRNQQLADSLVKDYLAYFRQLPEKELVTIDKIEFAASNVKYLTSKDKMFQLGYNDSEKIDALSSRGVAEDIVRGVIRQEELEPALWKGKDFISPNPNWDSIEKQILKKYPKSDINKIISITYKMRFYQTVSNWLAYADLVDLNLQTTPLDTSRKSWDISNRLNEPAWQVFLNCTDTAVLKRAIGWSDLSIHLKSEAVPYMDTRANLLYKLGRRKEAIDQEEKVIALLKAGKPNELFLNAYIKTLEKMQKGISTWNGK